MLSANHELVGIFHPDAGLKWFAAAEANVHRASYTTSSFIEQVGSIWFKKVAIIRVSAGIRDNAGSTGRRTCRAACCRGRWSPMCAKDVIFCAERPDGGIKRKNESI